MHTITGLVVLTIQRRVSCIKHMDLTPLTHPLDARKLPLNGKNAILLEY